MKDALTVLGDGARCRVLVLGAVTSTVGHLEDKIGLQREIFLLQWGLGSST